jgi:hypothetical protein
MILCAKIMITLLSKMPQDHTLTHTLTHAYIHTYKDDVTLVTYCLSEMHLDPSIAHTYIRVCIYTGTT